jgi:DDE superfamily endonuclease
MSRNARLPHHETIYQYIKEQKLDLHFSKPVQMHMLHFIDGVTQKGFSGTLTDIHGLSHEKKHRTTLSHFLQHGKWDDKWLQNHMKKQALQRVQQKAERTGLPIYVIVDDSLCEKTKPSSQAKSSIQNAYYAFSHKDKKQIWGHQVVVMLLKCGDLCLPYAFHRYDKNGKSKMDWVCDLIETLPVFCHPAYLLVDTWYNSQRIIHTSNNRGLSLIGGLKSNRILFPRGVHTQAKKFASTLEESDTRLVTMGDSSYHVHRYEGACKGLDRVVVLLCWPKGQVGNRSALRCFLSMDVSLNDEMILFHYANRWSIEVFFQFMKEKFAFDRYQTRSVQSIDRFWTLLFLTYLYVLQANESNVCLGLRMLRKHRIQNFVEWIYFQGQLGIPLHQIQQELNVA